MAAFAILLACAVVFLFSTRLAALPAALSVVVTLVIWVCGKRWRYAGTALACFAFFSLLPIDVRPLHLFGTPKMLPVVMGFPSPDDFEAARKGEVWLGGCIVSGFDPLWIITW